MNARYIFRLAISALLLIFLFLSAEIILRQQPTITYFPENPHVSFTDCGTEFRLVTGQSPLQWKFHSSVNTPVYLLQNFSLLYRNNRLIQIGNQWRKNAVALSGSKSLQGSEGFYQALTIHQAEIHGNSSITGQQVYSSDQLFLMKKSTGILSFSNAGTSEEKKQFQNKWIQQINQQQAQLIRKAAKKYGVEPGAYRIISLDGLLHANLKRIFSEESGQENRINAQLWEGIYQVMINGFQMEDGQYENVAGSSLPLILIGNHYLLVLISTADNRIVLLRQNF